MNKLLNAAKNNKRILLIILLCCILSNSLIKYINNKNKLEENIKINDYAFNMNINNNTTNILHLKSENKETFNILLTNLNKENIKYELTYDICEDNKCNKILKNEPNNIIIGYKETETNDNVSGIINKNKKFLIITENNNKKDYYVKLNLNICKENEELAFENKIKDLSNNSGIIAYVDGIAASDFPNSCNYETTVKAYNGSTAVTLSNYSATCDFSTKTWNVSFESIPTKLEIYFKYKNMQKITSYIDMLYKGSASANGLIQDDTTDKNIRYAGSSPLNYVTFNNETWRIIGIFNVTSVNNSVETTEKLVKIVRHEPIGRYAWDTGSSNENTCLTCCDYTCWGEGDHLWHKSHLQTELNTDYINSSLSANTNWYNGSNYLKTGVFSHSNVLNTTSLSMINDIKWKFYRGCYNNQNFIVNYFGDSFPGPFGVRTNLYSSDMHAENPTITNKVGLIYVSDFAYASTSSGCATNGRSADCASNNWISSLAESIWTMTPERLKVIAAFSTATSQEIKMVNAYSVLPVVYLKSNVEITGGSGTSASPYTLALK